MMTDGQFDALADEIMALGHDEETAGFWASPISDRPLLAPDGRVIVIDQAGRELAKLRLTFFSKKGPL